MQISVVDDTSEQNDDGCVESLTSVSGIYKAADGISDAVLIVMLQPVKANITNNNRQNTFKRKINITSYINAKIYHYCIFDKASDNFPQQYDRLCSME